MYLQVMIDSNNSVIVKKEKLITWLHTWLYNFSTGKKISANKLLIVTYTVQANSIHFYLVAPMRHFFLLFTILDYIICFCAICSTNILLNINEPKCSASTLKCHMQHSHAAISRTYRHKNVKSSKCQKQTDFPCLECSHLELMCACLQD